MPKAFGAVALRIGAHQYCGLVAEHVAAHVVEVVVESGAAVVPDDVAQGGCHLQWTVEVAELAEVRHVLTDQLVDEATVAELEFGLGRVGGAHGFAQSGSHVVRRQGWADLVAEVLAVEEVGTHPSAAVIEEPPALFGEVVLAEMAGHLLAGA